MLRTADLESDPMLFLYLSVIVGLIIGAIAGKIAASRNKNWRPTFILTSIFSMAVLFLVAFRFLVDHNVQTH